jgi:predicted dehydrogenase
MADKVKIGIIGVGQIGKRHIQNYQKLPVEIVAAADVNEAELKRVAQEHNIAKTFTDFRQLLKLDEIVAVDVCLHNNFHAPMAIAAMDMGRNVYSRSPSRLVRGWQGDGGGARSARRRC